jgi:hypothetical protein
MASQKKPFIRKVFPSGLTGIIVPQKDQRTVTVLVTVEAGSKYETKEKNGLSHFLEHMMFKGTTNRPATSMISELLDGLGAEYNAFTSQEWTGYYAKARSEQFPKLLDILSDLYLNPLLETAEIEKEKGVISDELNMYEDLPMRRVGEYFMELLYGDQPAGWPIGGYKEVIRTFGREDFLLYRKAHYVAKATKVIVAGNVDPKKDIDGFHAEDIAKLSTGDANVLAPATPQGVMMLLDADGIDVRGKHCVVIGRSWNLGSPLKTMLEQRGATVDVIHSKTEDPASIAQKADILFAAAGSPKLVKKNWVKPGAIVIDIGITRVGKDLVGDVDFDDVKDVASVITPVPGGVGPMTVASLLANCVKAAQMAQAK